MKCPTAGSWSLIAMLAMGLLWIDAGCPAGDDDTAGDDDDVSDDDSGGGDDDSGDDDDTGPTTWGLTEDWVVFLGSWNTLLTRQLAVAPDGTAYMMVAASDGWWIGKVDPDGNSGAGDWPKTLPATGIEWDFYFQRPSIALAVDPTSGDVIITRPSSTGWLTTRYSAAGATLWEGEYMTGSGAYPTGVLVDAVGRIVVIGQPGVYTALSDYDCQVIRYDAGGAFDEAFEISLTATGEPLLACSIAAADPATGDIYVAGVTTGSPTGHAIRKIAATGAVVTSGWNEADLFGQPPVTSAFDIFRPGNIVVADDGTVIAALVSNEGGGDMASRVIALPPEGGSNPPGSWQLEAGRLARTGISGLIGWTFQPDDEDGTAEPLDQLWWQADDGVLSGVGGGDLPPPLDWVNVENACGGPGDDLYVIWTVFGMTYEGTYLAHLLATPM